MGNRKIQIDQLAEAVNEQMEEYSKLSAEVVKAAVTKAGKESSTELEVTVYSPTRYMLAHLLEHGHAKRGGGRVKAIPHIAPAEEAAEEELMKDIERGLKSG